MASKIWKKEIDEFKLKPLTGEIIKKAEETFCVELPNAYLAILNEQNGGHIKYNAYPSSTPTVWGETFISVEHIRGIGRESGILNNAYLLKEWDMPEGLILFSGDGHTWLAFDYRNTIVDPPIIYIDNESEQIIQIADSFDEFLTNLYIEEVTFSDEDEYEIKEYSEQDLMVFVQQNKIEELSTALMQLSYADVDMKWFSSQLLQLSDHPSKFIRTEVAGIAWNISYRIEDATLEMLVEKFEKDPEADVQLYAASIKEKMNYSLEELKQEVERTGMASFLHDGTIYHVNEHSGLWHLSDHQTDFHSFHSVKDLIEQATIKGKTLNEIWDNIKIV